MSPPTRRLAELSDRALALRAQDGDPDAFDVLIDRHQGRLFRIAYLVLGDRQDSEDVVQETLLTAWKRLHLLEDPDAVRAWLAQICSRRATDIARRRARRATDAHRPEDTDDLAVCWNDARLSNAIFGDDGAIVGVLDWEQACLCPAETDFAWWLATRKQMLETRGHLADIDA